MPSKFQGDQVTEVVQLPKQAASKRKKRAPRPRWLTDPTIVVFGGERELSVGAIEQHSLGDVIGDLFGRSREEVRADWKKVVGQIRYLLEDVSAVTKDYQMEEIAFELGFSAEGQLVFVAKAGVTTTIRATFKKKPVRAAAAS